MEQATPTPNRRDRKKHATHQAIIRAALDLFEEKGFAATTVDEITERADVAQRTFFRHFPTKEAVLFPNNDHAADVFRHAVATRPTTEPLLTSTLAAFAEALAASSQEDHALTARRRAILEREGSTGDSITWQSIVTGHRLVEEAIADHSGRDVDDPTVQLVASTAILILTRAMPRWFADGGQRDVAALIDEELDALRAVLSAPA